MYLFLEADGLKDPQGSGLLAFLVFTMSICGLSSVRVESVSPILLTGHRPGDSLLSLMFSHYNPPISLSHPTVWNGRKRRGLGVRFISRFCLLVVTLGNLFHFSVSSFLHLWDRDTMPLPYRTFVCNKIRENCLL